MKKLLFILMSALVLTSCGAKKKLVDREKTKVEIREKTKTDSTFTETVTVDSTSITKSDSTSVKKTEEVTISDSETIDIEGSGGDITVEEEITPSGNKKVTITGAERVTIRNENVRKQLLIDEYIRLITELEAKTRSHKEEITTITKEFEKLLEEEKSRRVTDVETSGPSFMTYVWIGIILLILIVIAIARKWIKRMLL